MNKIGLLGGTLMAVSSRTGPGAVLRRHFIMGVGGLFSGTIAGARGAVGIGIGAPSGVRPRHRHHGDHGGDVCGADPLASSVDRALMSL